MLEIKLVNKAGLRYSFLSSQACGLPLVYILTAGLRSNVYSYHNGVPLHREGNRSSRHR